MREILHRLVERRRIEIAADAPSHFLGAQRRGDVAIDDEKRRAEEHERDENGADRCEQNSTESPI